MNRHSFLLAGGVLFASLGNGGMVDPAHGAPVRPKLSPSVFAPGRVTTLVAAPVSDTSVVLTWTEVTSGNTAIARYVVRYGPVADFTWGAQTDVLTGGCGAPIYGSTTAGGRIRSCLLGGLSPRMAYSFQLVAYTGALGTTTNFGLLSNVANAITAERIGPMVVWRPGINAGDSAFLRSVWFSAPGYSKDTFPMKGWFNVGSYSALAFLGDSVVLRGYLLVVRP